MKIFENVDISAKINNYYFSKLGLDYKDIMNNSGLVETTNAKGKKYLKPWFEVFFFEKEEDYLDYRNHVINELKKHVPDKEIENEFYYFDLFHGPVQKYLFDIEKEKRIKVSRVDEESSDY